MDTEWVGGLRLKLIFKANLWRLSGLVVQDSCLTNPLDTGWVSSPIIILLVKNFLWTLSERMVQDSYSCLNQTYGD